MGSRVSLLPLTRWIRENKAMAVGFFVLIWNCINHNLVLVVMFYFASQHHMIVWYVSFYCSLSRAGLLSCGLAGLPSCGLLYLSWVKFEPWFKNLHLDLMPSPYLNRSRRLFLVIRFLLESCKSIRSYKRNYREPYVQIVSCCGPHKITRGLLVDHAQGSWSPIVRVHAWALHLFTLCLTARLSHALVCLDAGLQALPPCRLASVWAGLKV